MGSSRRKPVAKARIVIDNLHGDIRLTEQEWKVVNTATFQRLRFLKQLGMGHLTYPNATHTRFAHSLGVFKIMTRVVALLDGSGGSKVTERDRENLRLAALLHDIGHYPYSHLMERVDKVSLTEEIIEDLVEAKRADQKKTLSKGDAYPDHEELGRYIIENQSDIRKAIGSKERAMEIGVLFSRTEAADPQLSKLIHSSLDMDRMDYLMRDARAAGVPYGEIDLNYLLNNIRVSPEGRVGIDQKALPAAEHFLLARLFMHRAVYFHKTTYALEEACRQLLRRLRDVGQEGLAAGGREVRRICGGAELLSFNDSYVDRIVLGATRHSDPVISTLARCIAERKPPKLVREVSGLHEKDDENARGPAFRKRCHLSLKQLAESVDLPLGQFLLCAPKPVKIEERSPLLTSQEADDLALEPKERQELIMVFSGDQPEPKSMIDIRDSVAAELSRKVFGIYRLFVADLAPGADERLQRIRSAVATW